MTFLNITRRGGLRGGVMSVGMQRGYFCDSLLDYEEVRGDAG